MHRSKEKWKNTYTWKKTSALVIPGTVFNKNIAIITPMRSMYYIYYSRSNKFGTAASRSWVGSDEFKSSSKKKVWIYWRYTSKSCCHVYTRHSNMGQQRWKNKDVANVYMQPSSRRTLTLGQFLPKRPLPHLKCRSFVWLQKYINRIIAVFVNF